MTANTTIALVTGGNKGIGRETVAQLAALGMTVLLAARDPELGAAAADDLRATGADVHPLALDVTDPATIAAVAKQIDERYGRLDVLVNNAGITGAGGRAPDSPDRPTPSTTDPDAVRRVFETNVFGVIAVTNAFLPLLLRAAAPRIVNVSSGVGSLAAMTAEVYGLPPSITYPVSKAALNAVTVQYAKEFQDTSLRVNAADPGFTATDLNGHRGTRSVAEGAAIVVRLATLPADGPSGGFFNDEGPVAW